MYQLSDEILSFYRQTQESNRLINDVRGQIEFARTQVACAIAAKCDYFVTTDDVILKRTVSFEDITVIDPPSFIRSIFDDNR